MIHRQHGEIRLPFHLAALRGDDAVVLLAEHMAEQSQRALVSHQHAGFRRQRAERLRCVMRFRAQLIHHRPQHPARPAQRLHPVDDLTALVRWHQQNGASKRKRRITPRRPRAKHNAAE